jgi:hypothetical protein
MMVRSTGFDGERVRKAHSVRQVAQIFQLLAAGLVEVPERRYIKIFPERIAASNVLSEDGKKNPVVAIGAEGLVAVELLIDTATQVVQFYAITSAVPGCGRKMVAAVVGATPEDWHLAVTFDWSSGFWDRMARDYPRLEVF